MIKIVKITFYIIAMSALLLMSYFVIAHFTTSSEQELSNVKKYPYSVESIDVIVENGAQGIFSFGRMNHGYFYEILKHYADDLGKDLNIKYVNEKEMYKNILYDSTVIFSVLSNKSARFLQWKIDQVEGCYDSTSYIVMRNRFNKRSNKKSVNTLLRTGAGAVPPLAYDISNVLLKRSKIDRQFIYSENINDAIKGIRQRKYDYVICPEYIARIFSYMYRSLEICHKFPTNDIVSSIFVSKEHNDAYIHFDKWFKDFKLTPQYKNINTNYHKKNYFNIFIKEGYLPPSNAISHYDHLFQKAAGDGAFKWQFIAAIAYKESTFYPYLMSPKGAVGVMQIMPRIAKSYDVEISSLYDPTVNIGVAIKLLEEIKKSLGYNGDELTDNQLSIILASYNAGIGHVRDAMRLAKEENEDPEDWLVVKKYLALKSKPEWYKKSVVFSGRFAGAATTNYYVSTVMESYEKYLLLNY